MKNLLVALAAGLALVASGTGVALAAPDPDEPYAPAGDTIVKVTGNAANGFTIRRYDGTSVNPPTDSEALAECDEYDTTPQRVRCRTQVRTWYRDLGDLKQALLWAHASS
jgi:hypothetical protein